jgi:hypothetical protein
LTVVALASPRILSEYVSPAVLLLLVNTIDVEIVTVSFAARENELIKMCELATVTFLGFKYSVTVCAEADVLHKTISLITVVVVWPLVYGTVYISPADVANAAGPVSLVGVIAIR